jgi:hypothetical protein
MQHMLKDEDVSITFYQGMDGLDSLREAWNKIVSGMIRRYFFHLWEWYKCYLKCLEPDPNKILFFLFTKGETPVAIFPLQFTSIYLRGLKLRALAFPSHDHMPLCDIICHRDALELPLFQLLVQHLQKQQESWDVLYLPHLLEEACAIKAIQQHPPSAFLSRREGGCDCIDVTGTYEAYSQRLSGKFRYNLKRTRQHLNQLPGVRFTFAQEGLDLDEGLDAFMDVEASGWKGFQGTGTAIKLQPRLVSFYRELTNVFSVSRRVAINTLHADGKCIAAQFCLLTDDIVYMLKIGYHEDYKRYAPGKHLVDLFIRRYMENCTVKSINFVAQREWHADWKPKTIDISKLYIFNTSLAGIIGFVILKCYPILMKYYQIYIRPHLSRRIQR